MKEINLTHLYQDLNKSWRKEFGLPYLNIFLDKGHIFGVKQFSRRGDTEEVELRMANKYEITIHDTYIKLSKLLSNESRTNR